MDKDFPALHLWRVTVAGYGTGDYITRSRGSALAAAWRSDLFNGTTFEEFLRMADAVKAAMPSDFGTPCTVEGKPARYFGQTRASVTVQMAGRDFLTFAHPSDVLPESLRPIGYRLDPVE